MTQLDGASLDAPSRALEGLEGHVDVPITRISGKGIGIKGRRLKQFIRGMDT